MSREDPQMKIRLPADLKDRIEALAKQAGRSMNAEIVTRLQQTLPESLQSAATQAQEKMGQRPVSPIIRVSPDGSSKEISVEELAQALAAAMAKTK